MKRGSLFVVVFLGLLACQDVEVYQQACDRGDMLGCNELGVRYGTGEGMTQNLARAATLYQQACDGGEMWGCVNTTPAGTVLAHGGSRASFSGSISIYPTLHRGLSIPALGGSLVGSPAEPLSCWKERRLS